ncbi:RNA-dependent RNA polymerase [Soybean thrips rhabdo-like virus 1]|uniref:Replicase n=1 Tax=Soybean thrips rhabdo-like virus 1 TaxID=2802235 RepID=A0A7T8G241_9RHAB|nr:RNA-dependent RNA polymerase [Soybean thrips rhabdo-like virus 1]
MDEYEEEEIFVEPDDFEESSGLDEFTDLISQKDEDLTDLVNQDYNLNSPINPDFINHFMECLISKKKPSIHSKKIKRNLEDLQRINSTDFIRRLPRTREFHQFFITSISNKKAHHFTKKVKLPKLSIDVITDIVKDIKDTLYVANSYEINSRQSMKITDELKKMGLINTDDVDPLLYKWMFFDALIKVRNHKKIYGNLTNLGISFISNPIDMEVGKSRVHVLIKGDNNLKDIIFTNDLYFFLNEKIFLTHEEVLMIKDVLFARYITYSIIESNFVEKYSSHISGKFTELLNFGDDVVYRHGNVAYDSIKMLETLCNRRWIELSEDTEYTDLTKELNIHVEAAISEDVTGFCDKADSILKSIDNPDDISVIFGSFRIWGHPQIEIESGLLALKELVRKDVEVDEEYANLLASDLARICITSHYEKHGVWPVDISRLERKSKWYDYINTQTWPNKDAMRQMPDKWNLLPITKIYDVPEDINLSTLYSDKSHSGTRSELYQHLSKDRSNPIQSAKVLNTLLSKNIQSPNELLKDVAENGIPDDDLIIGLREKERELKRKGRFFTLMSWKLRDYIVLTEYLIKKFFLPHFQGITMADGLTTVTKKMLKLTNGQSGEFRKMVSIANHIDYEKWNNLQRGRAVNPIFRVMDLCLGFSGPVIERTHFFFEKMLVYCASRPDKLHLVKNNEGLVLADESITDYAWNGQPGGFEGVRQKGWTVCGALVVLRESARNKVKVNLLAQGDNQIIVTNFKLPKKLDQVIDSNSIISINKLIMERIFKGAEKMGLSINRDETMSSSRFFIYGKIPIFRGNFINLETKKWSRANCVSNDQIPTCMNIMGAVSTTAIGSSQFDDLSTSSYIMYNIISLLCMMQSVHNNPISRPDIKSISITMFRFWTYIDKSIGGFTGMSPNRMNIRQFPDPITESLSYLRELAKYDKKYFGLYWIGINPIMNRSKSFESLVEDPSGLNIQSGSSIETILKMEVRKALLRSKSKIINKHIRSALEYDEMNRRPLYSYLESIKPCFPRFLSEFKESTELGLSDTIIGLVQNSRTMRNMFRYKFSNRVKNLILRGEEFLWRNMTKRIQSIPNLKTLKLDLNKCTSSIADNLRKISWKREIVGVTVPHPLEYLTMSLDTKDFPSVICSAVRDIPIKPRYKKGPLSPYLGSKTTETTSVINHWDKEIKNPLSRNAFNLLRAINWFVKPESNLGSAILDNFNVMCNGLDINLMTGSGERTGTALHRFSSSRVSNGGFIPINPNLPSWMFVSAESLGEIRQKNYDFMYQATMLYCQTVFCSSLNSVNQSTCSFYWNCQKCLREVDELILESPGNFFISNTKREHGLTTLIRPLNTVQPLDTSSLINIIKIDEASVTQEEMNYYIGVNIGMIMSLQKIVHFLEEQETSIFPTTLRDRLNFISFGSGFLDGVRLGSSLAIIRRYRKGGKLNPMQIAKGSVSLLLTELRNNSQASALFDSSRIRQEMIELSGFVPPSFPTSEQDMSTLLIKTYNHIVNHRTWEETLESLKKVPLFSDTSNPRMILLLTIGPEILRVANEKKPNVSYQSKKIHLYKSIIQTVLSGGQSSKFNESLIKKGIRCYSSEIRHALGSFPKCVSRNRMSILDWDEKYGFTTIKFPIETSDIEIVKDPFLYNKRESPIISSLRTNRLPTGAHYKIRSIIKDSDLVPPELILSIGDGSGGCGSALMRIYRDADILHNSLILTPSLHNGILPQLPSGYLLYDDQEVKRLINRDDYWKHPSDLSLKETWEYFSESIIGYESMGIFCDAEVTDDRTQSQIDKHLKDFVIRHSKQLKWYVIKVYDDRLLRLDVPVWGSLAKNNHLVKTLFTSAYSLESYIISTDLSDDPVYNKQYLTPNTLEQLKFGIKYSMNPLQLDTRVRRILKGDFDRGIPPHLNFKLIPSAQDYFYVSGWNISQIEHISSLIRNKSIDLCKEILRIQLSIMLNEGKSTYLNMKGLLIPSRSELSKLGGVISGISMIYGYYGSKRELITYGECMIENGLTARGKYTKIRNKELYRISFLKKDTEKITNVIKNVCDAEMRDHASVIMRMLFYYFKKELKCSIERNQFDGIDFFDLIKKYNILSNKKPGSRLAELEQVEVNIMDGYGIEGIL